MLQNFPLQTKDNRDGLNQDRNDYALPLASDVPKEASRLERHSQRIREFLNGRLSLAPLEQSCKPSRILELGSGSGYWAVQAAETFPDAEVIAMDLSPMPSYQLNKCSNLRFQIHDLTQPFPFDLSSFDIIHARFVFMHLPKLGEIMDRTIALLKPGGYLLLEDVTNGFRDDTMPLGPGVTAFWEPLYKDLERRGIDPQAPSIYIQLMEQTGAFKKVNVKKVRCSARFPVKAEDPASALLGGVIRDSFTEGPLLHYPGTSPEVVQQVLEEMRQPGRDMYYDAYWVWAKKNGE